MNELVTRQQSAGLAISSKTKELIQSSIADARSNDTSDYRRKQKPGSVGKC